MARFLNVYLKSCLVGRLEQDDSGSLWFEYDVTWLDSQTALPLSASLPLQGGRFNRTRCRPFFAGLLPEETSRKLIAKTFGISDKNDFAILERIGAECAGAVSLIPPSEQPAGGQTRYRAVSLDELAAKFADLPLHPLLAGQEGVRLSLAGAQGKLAVAIRDGAYLLPLDGSPSTHILKPESPGFSGLVANEFFCMSLAVRVALETAAVETGVAGDIQFLQVARFDRHRMPDGSLERIHQEDFCQALGIPPELKYQQEGGPNLQKCFELVRAVSAIPGPDILRLFDAVVFNYLIGNSDAHGKNFSFLYAAHGARLAPFYDLVCTRAYPALAVGMAMKIGGERDPERVLPRNWLKFFKDVGIGRAVAQQRLLALGRRVLLEVQAMAEEPSAGTEEVAPLIVANCQRLLALDWQRE